MSLTMWETHRWLEDETSSYSIKKFAFNFCAKFFSIFYIAFLKGYISGCDSTDSNFCKSELQAQVLAGCAACYDAW